MFNKVYCRYFPECLDGDECFFEHEKDCNVGGANDGSYCLSGEKCNDQSCNFSEQKHSLIKPCKFQANCTRLNCPFKHNVARKSFLEESSEKNTIN